MSLILLIAPSLWILVKTDTPGFWTWKYLAHFLFAIGLNVSLVCAGLLMLSASRRIASNSNLLLQIQKKHTAEDFNYLDPNIKFNSRISYFFKLTGTLVIGMSVFYFFFSLFPVSSQGVEIMSFGLFTPENKVTTLWIYFTLLFLGSVFSSYAIILISRALQLTGSILEIKLKEAINFIFRVRSNHYPKVGSKALYAELHDRAMKADESVSDNAEEFEEDFLDTMEKITDVK